MNSSISKEELRTKVVRSALGGDLPPSAQESAAIIAALEKNRRAAQGRASDLVRAILVRAARHAHQFGDARLAAPTLQALSGAGQRRACSWYAEATGHAVSVAGKIGGRESAPNFEILTADPQKYQSKIEAAAKAAAKIQKEEAAAAAKAAAALVAAAEAAAGAEAPAREQVEALAAAALAAAIAEHDLVPASQLVAAKQEGEKRESALLKRAALLEARVAELQAECDALRAALESTQAGSKEEKKRAA